MRLTAVAAAAFVVVGCASDPVGSSDPFGDVLVETGSADNPGSFPVTGLAPGDRIETTVLALPAGVPAEPENLHDSMRVFRIDGRAGETVAVVVRGGNGLDPYVLLKDREGATLFEPREQAVLFMAAEEDGVIVFTPRESEPYLLFVAGGPNFDESGPVTVDLVALSESPGVDLGITHAGLRAVTDELRASEADPLLIEARALGAVEEQPTGYLATGAGVTELDLRSRADLNGVVARVNSLREALFDSFVMVAYDYETPDYDLGPEHCNNGRDDDDDGLADCDDADCDPCAICVVGRVCAELWAVFQ